MVVNGIIVCVLNITNFIDFLHEITTELIYFLGESMLTKARAFGDRDLFRKAQNINLPSCESLQKYLNT